MVKHLLLKTASGVAVAAFLFVLPQSCVNEEYDLSQGIDMTVSFGGDALVFPLGSTEKLKFSTFLSEEDFEYLTSDADGKYRIEFSDEFDFNDKIPDIAGELDRIEDVTIDDINMEIPVDFADIKGTTFGPESIESSFTFDDVTLPEIDLSADIPQQTFQTGLSDYIPSDDELTLEVGTVQNIEFDNIIDPSRLAGYVPSGQDFQLDAGIINSVAGNSLNISGNTEFQLNTTFPENITSVSNVTFDPNNTEISVSVKLVNPFFDGKRSTGAIIPDARLDLSQLLILEGDQSIIDLGGLELNAENGFENSAIFKVAGLVLNDGDFSSDGTSTVLNKNATLSAAGKISFEGEFHTNSELITSAKPLGISVEVAAGDFVIADMTVGIKPIEVSQNQDIRFSTSPISLPDEITVKDISEIRLEPGSSIDITVSSGSLGSISGLNTSLDNLTITFPDMIESSEFDSENSYTVSSRDLGQDLKISIPVDRILPPDIVDNQITIDEMVTVQAAATASGTVALSSLRQAAAGNSDITVDISTDNLRIADYTLQVEPVVYEVNREETFEVELPDGVKDIGNITVIPEGNPAVEINTSLPSVEGITLRGDGLVLKFPEMLVFGEDALNQGYNPQTHSITFNDEIPRVITLPIESLNVTPEENATGGYIATGKISVSGNVVAEPASPDGSVTSDEIQAVLDSEIGINAGIPEVTVGSVSIDRFETTFNQTSTFTLFNFEDLPDELVSVDKVYLNGSNLQLSLDATNIPEMNAPVMFNVDVVLPAEIVVDSDYADETQSNILHISGKLDEKGHFEPEPIAITELNLAELDLSQTGPYEVEISMDGSVSVDNPSINVDELSGNINVAVSGGIPVNISKVTGYVDYRLDTEDANQSIDIRSELPDILKDGDFSLDLSNPYIVLTVNTNIGIPVEAELELIPYYDDVADTEKSQKISVTLEPAASISAPQTTVYYVCENENAVPAGGKWIEADIRSLLADLPDRIDVNVDAGTVSDQLSTVEVVEGESYILNLAYDVVAPLEFGEEMRIAMEYTYPDDGSEGEGSDGNTGDSADSGKLPEILGELLNMNSLGLSGTIESTLPLQLTMTATLLDSEKMEIPTEPLKMEIQAGSEANPSVSDIDFVVKLAEGADGTDLSYIKLNFEVSSGNMSGEPVTTESFVQATLKAKVPGGVTVDISSLGESENQDENL